MDFNIDFNLVRAQKLLLIPQLKQALDILEMNSRELFNYMENQLESNPALEEAIEKVLAETLEEEIAPETEDDPDSQMTEVAGATLSLKEHLLIQLNSLCPDKCEHRIGEYLIDNTDDNGYLKVDIREVAAFFNVPDENVLRVLDKLQSLDPPGICARSLRECLLLQLGQLDEADEEAMLVVEKYLDELASDDVEAVAISTGLSADRIREIFCKVKSLEPRPGREFYDNETESPAPPDIIIRETNDGLQVLYNEEAFPDICVSESFTMKASSLNDSEDGDYVHDKVKSAVWLIKCLEQREDIIFSIAQKLCAFEQDFFKTGPKAIKLLDRSSFAAMLDMHESILEKALNGKYLQCRWGTFELKSFFDEIAKSLYFPQ